MFYGRHILKITGLFLVAVFGVSAAVYGADGNRNAQGANSAVTAKGAAPTTSQNSQGAGVPHEPPLKPYPRLLPLELTAPPTAAAGKSITDVYVSLSNPGDSAPNSRLRLIIHNMDKSRAGGYRDLSPSIVTVEVLENGSWVPVLLSMVEGNLMGAIGADTGTTHSELYKRGGFEIPAGLSKTWQFRVTFSMPGTYSIVAAVSPDNGSRHVAQPAHSIIQVQ